MEEQRVKIVVTVKRVVDYNVKVRAKSDNTGVDIANVKMPINKDSEAYIFSVVDYGLVGAPFEQMREAIDAA